MRYFIILCVAFLFANHNCPASWMRYSFGKPQQALARSTLKGLQHSWTRTLTGQYQFTPSTSDAVTRDLLQRGCGSYVLRKSDFAQELASGPHTIYQMRELYATACCDAVIIMSKEQHIIIQKIESKLHKARALIRYTEILLQAKANERALMETLLQAKANERALMQLHTRAYSITLRKDLEAKWFADFTAELAAMDKPAST